MDPIQLQKSITDYDQRIFIKFCVLLNKSTRESHDLLSTVLGKAAYPYSTVARWVQSFKSGQIGRAHV